MPTPRPISVASCGEKVAMVNRCASRPLSASAEPSEMIAVPSGSSVANSEPNASARTIAAAMKPMSSLGPAALLLVGLLDARSRPS